MVEQPGMFIQSRLVPSPSLDPRHRKEIADNAVEMLGVTFIWTSRSRRAGSGRRAPSGALHQTRSPWRRLVSRRDHFVALTEEQTRSAIGELPRHRLSRGRGCNKGDVLGKPLKGVGASRLRAARSRPRAEMRSGSRSASHRQNATPRDEHVEANSTTLPEIQEEYHELILNSLATHYRPRTTGA